MTHINDGQCGLCKHFGEHSSKIPMDTLVKIRTTHEADEEILAECGHPNNEKVHLMVTPIAGCNAYEPAQRFSYSFK